MYLVGTAHVSRQSAEDVQRVIQAVRPQNVIVELCSSRTAVMYNDVKMSNDGTAANSMESSGAGWSSTSASSQHTDATSKAASAAERQASAAGASASGQHSRASNPMALR